MLRCSSCSAEVPVGSRFCPSCAAPLASAAEYPADPELAPTEMAPEGGFGAPSSGRSNVTSSPSATARDGSRFLPGTLLAERYRIVGLLGRGGMGEVYRADDLKLGQAVALKFLPEVAESDEEWLTRFLNEVKIARQISNPNVCRVYDIGEVDGHHFLSMEYIDGEDLSSLLRRIGRLPQDKAIQIARQVCAGLAAAHDQGILHRDLKPANVMIDGRGNAKITDFGLAGLAASIAGAEVGSGTPAYMAPEQLAGREVSVSSDVYSLGLVLYELVTGKQAFKADSLAELSRLQQEEAPSSLSSVVEGIDPAVERVILRCLEKEPGDRPASALAVAAALPGGDPLAVALAAGETPSPELVAEAGASGGLEPPVAVACLTLFLIALGVLVGLSGKVHLVRRVTLETPPEVLEAKARDVVRAAGYEDSPADSLYAFLANEEYIRHLRDLEPTRERWSVLGNAQPAGVRFAYRQSPRLLVRRWAKIGHWLDDPPPTLPGMVEVRLDLEGRLLSFSAVPPRRVDAGEVPAIEPDWAPLFAAAGFDRRALTPVDPVWLPPVYADRRAAWEGVYPEAPETSIRVEAAAYRGRPLAFYVIEPWTRAVSAASPATGAGDASDRGFWAQAPDVLIPLVVVLALVGSGLVALRNIRLGRGDRRTALRFALYLGGVLLVLFLGAHHIPSSAELGLFFDYLASALLYSGLVYVFYLALEPYFRRLWPRMLVSWVRLMGGRLRDPLVGRDLLVGSLYGAGVALIGGLMRWAPELLGVRGYGFGADAWAMASLRGLREAIAALASVHAFNLYLVFLGIVVFLVLRLLLRRTWIAVAVTTVFNLVGFYPGAGHPLPYVIAVLMIVGLFWLVLFRFGLLPVLVGSAVQNLLDEFPLTFDLTAWYGQVTLLVLPVVVAVALWGFRVALAGRALFRDEILAGASK